MAQKKRKTKVVRTRKRGNIRWSMLSLGVIVIILLLALLGLLILLRNAAQEHLQSYGISESRRLEQISADMDTIDVDVIDGQTQLLPNE